MLLLSPSKRLAKCWPVLKRGYLDNGIILIGSRIQLIDRPFICLGNIWFFLFGLILFDYSVMRDTDLFFFVFGSKHLQVIHYLIVQNILDDKPQCFYVSCKKFVINPLDYICEVILSHVFYTINFTKEIWQKYDMATKIDDMAFKKIWHE